MSATTGTVEFIVDGTTYQTWYMVVGDLKTSSKTPLVALHGGPGMSHHYMLPHKTIYEKAGIPVVLYDQIGNGASSHVKDVPTEFWKPELFMDELDNLLAHLGISDKFDLLGHSWGGMLAGHYAAARTPNGLKRLIITNAPASADLFEQSTNTLLEQFPGDLAKILRKHEAEGTTGSPEYQEAMMKFNRKHICDIDPWPPELMQSFGEVMNDPTVYSTMWGSSDFNMTGTMKGWSVIDIVHNIKAPTLLLSAPLDEVQPVACIPWFLGIPKIKWVEFQHSTHLAQFEEPERYFEVVLGFLNATA
ncbi:proline-specific peptidase [Armillaria solidipes]|uniref:Proline-specific peptidase n=1 Tax=Armillaria solidipes TaxID=1076256 RepID=A0A2H3C1L1_9AGAR|nr:proline-specific peptidase [Armillaria solidipes]